MGEMTAPAPPSPLPPTAPSDGNWKVVNPLFVLKNGLKRHPHIATVGRDDRGHRHRHAVGDTADLRRVRHRTGADDRGEPRDVILDHVAEDGRRCAIEGGHLGGLEHVGPRVALGGREEEIDFQVAQERDSERGSRTRIGTESGQPGCDVGPV